MTIWNIVKKFENEMIVMCILLYFSSCSEVLFQESII